MESIFLIFIIIVFISGCALLKFHSSFILFIIIFVFIVYFLISLFFDAKCRKKIKTQYKEIEESFPEGLEKWNKLNPDSTKENTVSNRYKIKDYEQAIKKAQEFDKWEEEQKEFTKKCRDLVDITMPDFGCYPYQVPFKKTNDEGKSIDGNYKVWQSFAGSYCLETDLEYVGFERVKENTNNLNEFRNRSRYYLSSVYEKIRHFIERLNNDYPISIYLCANNQNWSAESLQYHYYLCGDGAPFYDLPDNVEVCDPVTDALLNETEIDYDNYPILKNRHIVIVEMQTDNEHLKRVCKNIIEKNKENKPLITYISFLKGYDRKEMIELINQEKQKLSTSVDLSEIEAGYEDEKGVIYSNNGYKLLSLKEPYKTQSYTIKSGTLVICDDAFSDFWDEIDCNYINEIVIPKTVIKIGKNPFHGRVSKVICQSPYFEVIDDILYDKNKKLIQCFNRGYQDNNIKTLIIPDGVCTIGERAFYSCMIDSLVIPSSVNRIEVNPFVEMNLDKPLNLICKSAFFKVIDYALYDIRNGCLISYFGKSRELKIPNGTKIVGGFSFWGTTTLESIFMPNSIEIVEENAFGYTWDTLKKIVVPSGTKRKFETLLPKHVNILEEDNNNDAINYKPEKDAIIRLLDENNIHCFYHFTARDNLALIKKHGGLYSWWSLKQKKIDVPFLGGEGFGQQLDIRYGLQDYVRLSFCDDHPMIFKHQQNGIDLVLLKIDTEVATWKGTLFSDINATDNDHHHGDTLSDLRMVDFHAVKRNFVRRDDEDFKPHQAEIMVKTFIPIQYIKNIDSPLYL